MMERSIISTLLQLNEKIEDDHDNDIKYLVQDLDNLFGYHWNFTFEQHQAYVNLKKSIYLYGNANTLKNIRPYINHFLISLNYLKKKRHNESCDSGESWKSENDHQVPK